MVGSNNNVYRQLIELQKRDNDINIIVLNIDESIKGRIIVENSKNSLNYVSIGNLYSERILSNKKWNEAIEFGIEIINKYKPDIIHLHHWKGLWWMLESGILLNKKNIFTAHDHGLGCLRTVLVNNKGNLCDGRVELEKCYECYWQKNKKYKNNLLTIYKFLNNTINIDLVFKKRGTDHLCYPDDIENYINRIKYILSNINKIIVPNLYAKEFYSQFSNKDNIEIVNWYYG
jgi:hypothetical protein